MTESTPLWGTFAVNDHLRSNAFAREVLLFDRVVVPVPADGAERDRWKQPNPKDPTETWDPDRLDRLLAVLGSQRQPGADGARMAWEAPWDSARWQRAQSRTEVASTITQLDAFYTTRVYLAMDERLPGKPEAVAAFPSARACRDELHPLATPPADATAARALILMARPLLVPDGDETPDFRCLREAIELAREPEFQQARAAYHQWMRDLVSRLDQTGPGPGLDVIPLDKRDLQEFQQRLDDLLASERKAVDKAGARRRWTRIEYAAAIVALGTGIAGGLGAIAAFAGFVGWLAGKQSGAPPAPRPLGGASMFLMAEHRLDWGP